MPHPRPAGRLCFTCISLSRLVLSCIILYYLVVSCIILYYLVLSCIILYQLALSCILSYYLVSFRDIFVGRPSHGNALPVPSSYRFSVPLIFHCFFIMFFEHFGKIRFSNLQAQQNRIPTLFLRKTEASKRPPRGPQEASKRSQQGPNTPPRGSKILLITMLIIIIIIVRIVLIIVAVILIVQGPPKKMPPRGLNRAPTRPREAPRYC